MTNNKTLFQICQKLVVVDEKNMSVLLARRKGEADYDGVYSFIGGKLETSDGGIINGIEREKNEEIGDDAKITVDTEISWNTFFVKKDGSQMLLPHYYARYDGGEIALNPDEYDDFQWVKVSDLDSFEPKIANIPNTVKKLIEIRELLGNIKKVSD